MQIDLNSEMKTNPYFKQLKEALCSKPCSKKHKTDGNTLILEHLPMLSWAPLLARKDTYYLRLNELREILRPLMTALYQSPVKRHLTRFKATASLHVTPI